MKTLFALCLLVSLTFSSSAQSTNKLTPEQQAKVEAMKKQTAEMNAEMKKITEAAQQRALERQARLATNPPVPPAQRDQLKPFYTKRAPWFDTNAWYPGLGDDIKIMERNIPGVSTNFSAAQRALTNRSDKAIGPKPSALR